MSRSRRNSTNLKDVVKTALTEIFEENQDLVRHFFQEAIEDAYLSKSIKEGRKSRRVSRQQIFKTIAELTR